jgi:transcriptional regulator with XRE-family HTH domain
LQALDHDARVARREVSEAIQAKLRELGWKQNRLAKECGVSPSAVSRWLSGEREPGKEQIRKLVDVLGLSAEVLV